MSALDKQVAGDHYKKMPIQPIEFITKNDLDWYQGNIVKYATRHHAKGGADDLRKVIHYAELALEAQYGEKPASKPDASLGAFKRLGTKDQKEHVTRAAASEAMQDDPQWMPPQQEGFGPWIKHDGGECPVPGDAKVLVLLRGRAAARKYHAVNCTAGGFFVWRHKDCSRNDQIVAYCVKL